MAKISTEAINVYGAKIIYKYVSAMQAEVEGVMISRDIENIHRMRVTTRRLRSAFRIFSDCFPKSDYKAYIKDIRDVTRALGQARDLDVQIEILEASQPEYADPRLSAGIARLLLRLKQKRQAVQSEVVEAMKTLEADETLRQIARWAAPWLEKGEKLYLYSPALFELAFSNIQTRLDELLAFDQQVRIESNQTQLHDMRISAKRLRYTMETFEGLYGEPIKPFITQTKKIQDLLGAIHDADVWIAMIPVFIKEEEQRITSYFGHNRPLRRLLPGLKAFSTDRKTSRDTDYQAFLALWDKVLESETWETLTTLISAPLNIAETIKLLRKMEDETN